VLFVHAFASTISDCQKETAMTRLIAIVALLTAGACTTQTPETPTDSLESHFDNDLSAVSVRYADGSFETQLFHGQHGVLATATWHADSFVWEWNVAGLGYGDFALDGELTMERGNADLHAMWSSFAAQRGDEPYLYGDPWEMCRAIPGACNCTFPPCPWEQELEF
jgi:hypothetical protein